MKNTILKAIFIAILLVLIASPVSAFTFTDDFLDSSNIASANARLSNGKLLSKPLSPINSLISSLEEPIEIPYNPEFDENNDQAVDLNDLEILNNRFSQITARLGSSKNDVSYKLLNNNQYSELCPFFYIPSVKFCDLDSNGIIEENDVNLFFIEYNGHALLDEIIDFLVANENRQLIHIENSMYMQGYDLNNDNLINEQDKAIVEEKINSFLEFPLTDIELIESPLTSIGLQNLYLLGSLIFSDSFTVEDDKVIFSESISIKDEARKLLYTAEKPNELRCSGSDTRLNVYDVSNEQNPALINSLTFENSGSVASIDLIQNYLIVSVIHCGHGTGKVLIYERTYSNDLYLAGEVDSVIGYPQFALLDSLNQLGIFSIETDADPGSVFSNIAPFEHKATKAHFKTYDLNLNNKYQATSTIESKPISLENPALKARLSAVEKLNSQSIKYYISADNGNTWQLVNNNQDLRFANSVNSAKWKAELISNKLETPELEKVSLTFTTTENHQETQVAAVKNIASQITVSPKISLRLTLNNDLTANMAVSEFTDNPEVSVNGFKKPLGRYVVIEPDQSIRDNLNNAAISVSYTDNEIVNLNLDENTLKFYFFNPNTNAWEAIQSSVDTANNIVTGITTHFSTFGVSGDELTTVISSSGGSSSSGSSSSSSSSSSPRSSSSSGSGQTVRDVPVTKPAEALPEQIVVEQPETNVPEITGAVAGVEDNKKLYLGIIILLAILIVGASLILVLRK